MMMKVSLDGGMFLLLVCGREWDGKGVNVLTHEQQQGLQTRKSGKCWRRRRKCS